MFRSRLLGVAIATVAMATQMLVAAKPAQAAINVACVGDSITYGVNLASGQTYPAQPAGMLGSGYNVQNFGNPGLALMKLNPQPAYHPAYVDSTQYQAAISSNPNIVVIMLGTNDASFAPYSGQTWDQSYDNTYKSQYQSLISTFKNLASHPKVYVMICTKVFGANQYGIDANTVNNSIQGLDNQIASAAGVSTINAWRSVSGMNPDFGDNVHPDANGAKAIADIVYNALSPYTSGPIANGTYTFTPKNATGQRLDGANWGIGNGDSVQTYAASGWDNQRWVVTNEGNNTYKIQPSYCMSQALDVSNGGPADGAKVQYWYETGGINQQWKFTAYNGGYTITPQCQTAARMDVSGNSSANGTPIQIWTANFANNQTWVLTPAN